MAGPSNSHLPPIIIRKIKKGGHGGHGSSTWKIALADFMTAMFIIFLLLWLINQTTPQQKTGIADYFSPASASRNPSGSGAILGGQTITSPGAMKSNTAPLGPPGGGPSSPQEGEGNTEVPGYPGALAKPLGQQMEPGVKDGKRIVEGRLEVGRIADKDEIKYVEEQKAAQVERQIRQMIQEAPELQGMQQNVLIEPTPEGTRISLIDNEKQELFARASARPLPQTEKLLAQVAKVVAQQPNKIAISGHTDNSQYGPKSQYTNWELSADRANASRRVLQANGLGDDRIASVTGVADRDPLFPSDPTSPRNRRISMVLLSDKPVGGLPPQEAAAPAGTPAGAAAVPAAPPGPTVGPAPTGPLIRR